MKIFISWSGSSSKLVASAISEFLKLVFQRVQPFSSTDDIEKGAVWYTQIRLALQSVSAGIICLTPDNLNSAWLLFEAGALANTSNARRVTPLLVGVRISDIPYPLAQFQAVDATNKNDVFELFQYLNHSLDLGLEESVLEVLFESMWPRFEAKIKDIESLSKTSRIDDDEQTFPMDRNQQNLLRLTEISKELARRVDALEKRVYKEQS
ncbi:MAG: toll/interleukin-1 receptor domain-containing protein [Anaerolineae bacterium]|nr:toll/interleukin-1 receptor domain-containing protein [Anaerolineae bacterium]MCO5196398.1 toll/interleukin-1 receptor domain-containing protein [Anaerolineae bacterium]MCO5207561.1 toll/interleukin-1 receptor domain-containing protein [Anaerolineae bacterium]